MVFINEIYEMLTIRIWFTIIPDFMVAIKISTIKW